MSASLAESLTFFERVLGAEAEGRGDPPDPLSALATQAVLGGLRDLAVPEEPAITRALFRAWRRRHPELGVVHGAEVSRATSQSRGAGKYELLLVAWGDPLQLRSVLWVCTACVAVGSDAKGARCFECGGLGWEPWLGEALGTTLGEVEELRRVTRPSTNLYLEAWRAPG